jgi:hypothetical protein
VRRCVIELVLELVPEGVVEWYELLEGDCEVLGVDLMLSPREGDPDHLAVDADCPDEPHDALRLIGCVELDEGEIALDGDAANESEVEKVLVDRTLMSPAENPDKCSVLQPDDCGRDFSTRIFWPLNVMFEK